MIHRWPEPNSFAPSYLRGEPSTVLPRSSALRESAASADDSDGAFRYLIDAPYPVLREATGEPAAVAHAIENAKNALRAASEVCIGAGVDHDAGLLHQISDYLQHVKESARIR